MSHTMPVEHIAFISEFAAFCRTKGDETYEYINNHNCAIAQFLRASGRCANPHVSSMGRWRSAAEEGAAYQTVPPEVALACNQSWWESPFSDLADRLEALIADAPMVVKG